MQGGAIIRRLLDLVFGRLTSRDELISKLLTEKDTYPSEFEEVFDTAWALIKPKVRHRLSQPP